jgi:hydroxymethylglutaryl-CoA lyase
MHRSIRYFDVTLRDGLQAVKKLYSFQDKKNMLSDIIQKYHPQSMEIGSLVSPKVLPQMADSARLYEYAKHAYPGIDFYLLVPPTPKYVHLAKELKLEHISLITSVSEAFQQKNIKQSLALTKETIEKSVVDFTNVKLYVSCIAECPVSQRRDLDYITTELEWYARLPNIQEICISDTCGSLEREEFKTILKKTAIDVNRLSLHLHVNPERIAETNAIIKHALSSGIRRFDVTSFENLGGCSVTIDSQKLCGNLSYEQFKLAM